MTKSKSGRWALVLPVLALLAIESCARIVSTIDDDLHEEATDGDWFDYSKKVGWVRKPGYAGDVYGGQRTFDQAGYIAADSGQVGPKHRRRIIVLGDSNSFGNGVPTEATYAEVLERALGDVEVVNLAVPGYTSLQGSELFAEAGLALEPDLVIASFSFNDRRAIAAPENADGIEHFTRQYRANQTKVFRKSYLFRGIARGIGKLRTAPPQERFDLLHLNARVPPEAYERNLTRIAELSRARHVPVIFLLLADNPTSKIPPEAIAAIEKKDYVGAIGPLMMTRPRPFEWLRRKYFSIALEGAGRHDEAEKARYDRPRELESVHGGRQVYTADEYAAIMRRVATGEGRYLVDGGSALDEDPTVYLDFCHFNAEGHRKVAARLEQTIRALWPPAPSPAK